MAKKTPKRSPVRKPKRQAKKPGRKKKGTAICKDPLKEYRQNLEKDGLVEVLTLADDDCLANVRLSISTQSLALDRLLNGKGIPTGRVTEIYGENHIGKSTLIDHCFSEVQRIGGVAVLAEPEGAREVGYSQRIGVNPERLQYLSFPREEFHLENILQTFYKTIDWWRTNSPDTPVLIGLDALGGAATREEMTNQLSKSNQPGAAAKVLREASRQIPARLGNTKIAVVIANHEYESIKMTGRVGKKKETYGGGGLRHLASIRLSLFRTPDSTGSVWVKQSDGAVIGQVVGARLTKNRLGVPWGQTKFALISGMGVNNVWTVYEKFKEAKLLTVSGGWAGINLDGDIIKFQGWRGLQLKCEEDPNLWAKLVSVYQGLP